MSKPLSASGKDISELKLSLPYLVVFSAYLSCFKSNLVAVQHSQLQDQRFTSYHLLDMVWLELLFEAQAISIETVPNDPSIKIQDKVILIQSRINEPSRALGKELLQRAKACVSGNPELRVLLLDLLVSVLACECLQFIEQKAKQFSLDVTINTAPYEQLKTLLTHHSLDEVLYSFINSIHRIVAVSNASFIDLGLLIKAIGVDCEFLREHKIPVDSYADSNLSSKSTLHSHLIQHVLDIDEQSLRSKSALELFDLSEPVHPEEAA